MHKDLLCHYSSFFRAALTGGFHEAMTHEITLDEEDPKIFDIFVNSLYTGRLYEEKVKSADASKPALGALETDQSDTSTGKQATALDDQTNEGDNTAVLHEEHDKVSDDAKNKPDDAIKAWTSVNLTELQLVKV